MTDLLENRPSSDIKLNRKKSKSTKKARSSLEKSEATNKSEETESTLTSSGPGPTVSGLSKSPSKKRSKDPSQKSPEVIQTDTPVDHPKKSKKRKHAADHDGQDPGPSKATEDGSLGEPPTKKHKNRTEFADPRVDSTLNGQSRKSLEYAFLQMNRPSKWKFNKARQNWLIRNVWNPEAISDVYFPFVVKYLANTQGGSREKLKASCENHLKPKEKTLSTEIAVQTTKTEEQSANLPKSILKTKATVATKTPMAGPLIDVAPVLAESSTPDSDTPSKKATTAFSLHDIQKQRAQSLLDALGSPSSSMEI